MRYPHFVYQNGITSRSLGLNVCRFILKIPFIQNPVNYIIVILKNPSTATNTICDHTINKVCYVAYNHMYDGIIVLNVFPFRSKNPKHLLTFWGNNNYQRIMNFNKIIIQRACNGQNVVFAWGTNTISKANHNIQIFDSAILNIIQLIQPKNTYYVDKCKCTNPICSSNHSNIRYPLHGQRWSYDSRLKKY